MSDAPVSTAARIATTPLPDRMKHLPKDHRGYTVPRFVKWRDGKPDFRIMDPDHLVHCVQRHVCWICGESMGRYSTFVVGPMCIVNRTSAEPPSHKECAQYSAKVCPFLALPKMDRLPTHDITQGVTISGTMIPRNPGVCCLWTTRKFTPWHPRHNELLFNIGEPDNWEWCAHGREATFQEVAESLHSGMPTLVEQAMKDKDREGALRLLDRAFRAALKYLPRKMETDHVV